MKKNTLWISSTLFMIGVLTALISTAQGGDISSPSDNVPPKKEKLTQKIERFKNAGYKIGVNFTTPDLFVETPTSGTNTPTMLDTKKIPLLIEDAKVVCQCFADKTEDIIAKLNSQFGTDIFERVDGEQIPKRTVFGIETENWYSTKYKAVVHVLVRNVYKVSVESENKKKVSADYQATLSLSFVEYINVKNGRQKYLAQAANMIFSESYEAEVESTKNWKIADVKENVGTPSDDQLIESFESGYEETFGKFLDKVKKK